MASAQRRPWFPLYAGDLIASTTDMSAASLGGYIRLLCHQWQRGRIPADPAAIQRISGLAAGNDLEAVMERLLQDGGGYYSPRLEEESQRVDAIRDRRSGAARAVNERRWGVGDRIGNRPDDRIGDRPDDRIGNRVGDRCTHSGDQVDTSAHGAAANKQAQATPTDAHPHSKRRNRSSTQSVVGDRIGDRPDDRIAHRVADREYPHSHIQSPPTPQSGAGGGDGYRIPDESIRRIVLADPVWRTRMDRAEAEDLYETAADGSQIAVTPAAVLAAGRAEVEPRIMRERATMLHTMQARGLTPAEAHALWVRWMTEWLTGGRRPADALQADISDTTARDIAAVWRARMRRP